MAATSEIETGLPELSGLDEYYGRLERIGSPVDAPKHFRLFSAGELPDCCYLIKEGRVISFEYTNTGRQNVFSRTGPNEPDSLIVLPAMLLRRRLALSFMTEMPSELIHIRRENLLDAISLDPSLAIGIMNILSAKFLMVYEEFFAESRAAPWRLCNLLLSLADRYGEAHDAGVLIKLKYSQQMMADRLRMNRTTVADIIRELKDAGLIERVNDYYCIRSVDRLRRYRGWS